MMTNPYAQVALTYVRHFVSRAYIVYLIASGFFLLLVLVSPTSAKGILLMLVCAPYLSLGLVVHMTEQFAGWQGQLMPNARRLHGVVAAAMTLMLAIVLPAALTWSAGLGSVGAIAIMVLIFGAILWSITLSMATRTANVPLAIAMSVAPICVPLAVMSGSPHESLMRFLSGQHEPLAVAMLGLGAVMTVLGGIRLVRLDGDATGYQYFLRGYKNLAQKNQSGFAWGGMPLGSQTTRQTGLRRWWEERRIRELAEHVRRASTSRWSRVCRWQQRMATGWFYLGYSLFLFLLLLVMTWVSDKTASGKFVSILVGVMTGIQFPVIASAGVLGLRRTYALPFEFLMPVDRCAYLRQLGAAAATSHFQAWGSVCVGVALWWLIVIQTPLQLVAIVNMLACSALFQVGIFGLVVWGFRLAWQRSGQLVVLFLSLFAGLLAFAFSMLFGHGRPESLLFDLQHSAWPVVVTGLFAVLGVLLTWHTYRRWLVTDMD